MKSTRPKKSRRYSGIFPEPRPGTDSDEELTPDRERALWVRSFLKAWGLLYGLLWAVLTLSLTAENAYIKSAILATVIALFASLLITLALAAPVITITRFRRGRVGPDEKLQAFIFLMALLTLLPACWYLGFGWPTALAAILLIYQFIVLLARYSRFRDKLLGEARSRLFPNS